MSGTTGTALVHSSAIKAPKHVHDLLERLHRASLQQEADLSPEIYNHVTSAPDDFRSLMKDKFIALEPDKSAFVYSLIRSMGALNVVEAGTSFGVSTIYLALAVGQNAKDKNRPAGEAKVIATEHEPEKAAVARKHWEEAGESVVPWIELREGDLLQTLTTDLPTIDLVLFDIWTPMVVPTLKLLEQHFRPGTVLVADNVVGRKGDYADFYGVVQAGPYTGLTIPYAQGLGMFVYSP